MLGWTNENFEIELVRVERESPVPDVIKYWRVTFSVTRHLQHGRGGDNIGFEIPVWISPDDVPAEDVVKAALRQLHRDLSRLTEQTAKWSAP